MTTAIKANSEKKIKALLAAITTKSSRASAEAIII